MLFKNVNFLVTYIGKLISRLMKLEVPIHIQAENIIILAKVGTIHYVTSLYIKDFFCNFKG